MQVVSAVVFGGILVVFLNIVIIIFPPLFLSTAREKKSNTAKFSLNPQAVICQTERKMVVFIQYMAKSKTKFIKY
jgi:hypothetical protein